MWLIFAFLSALFAGLTAILAKCGIQHTDSHLATALRTIVVLIFSWIMVFLVGGQKDIAYMTSRDLVFIVLSGLATGGSWLCYFKALQLGDVNKVTPIDKSSTLLSMILAFIIFKEPLSLLTIIAMFIIAIGTYLMIQKKKTETTTTRKTWMIYAFASAFFASMTSILSKLAMSQINSHLATAIRTIVVLIMAWIIVFISQKHKTIKDIDHKSWLFLILSGFATGASWLCYFHALQTGPASLVVPIDKLSIVVTILFSYIVFKEKLSLKASLGLIMIVLGTLLLLI